MDVKGHYQMSLADIATRLNIYLEHDDAMVLGVQRHLKDIVPGDIWVYARPSATECMDAMQKGCVAVVCVDKPAIAKICILQVPDLEQAMGSILSALYQDASSHMQIVAVTGTNGKTTVSYLCAGAMQYLQKESVYIGTLGYGRFGDLQHQQLTTPACSELHEKIGKAHQQGADFVAMEASSHGLDQGRLAGVMIDVAIFTNLTHDHLDYHKTINDYLEAKQKLVMMRSVGVAVINYDDPSGKIMISRTNKELWPCSMESIPRGFSRWTYASIKEQSLQGMVIKLSTHQSDAIIKTHLIGTFNAENIILAHAALCLSGVSSADAAKALSSIDMIPGRMQRIKYAELSSEVIVDFAHTPNALERVLTQLNELKKGRLWVVFGCGGNRDQQKRGMMGAIAERLADEVIITEDNSRGEAFEDIVQDIHSGMRCPQFSKVINTRFGAIRYALREAAENDLVLIAGKGHEVTTPGGVSASKHFSDIELVEAILIA